LIERIQTQLVNLNDPFTDREFRELIYKATAVENDWKTWTQIMQSKRPALSFDQLKVEGQGQWALLHEGDIASIVPTTEPVKKETTTVNFFSTKKHDDRNCVVAGCPEDHGDLVWCSYHAKWTGHKRDKWDMLRADISLQNEAKHLRHGRGDGGSSSYLGLSSYQRGSQGRGRGGPSR
jgi:hypothetical protein